MLYAMAQLAVEYALLTITTYPIAICATRGRRRRVLSVVLTTTQSLPQDAWGFTLLNGARWDLLVTANGVILTRTESFADRDT